ncbi:MAG: aspartate dehydrogenase [Pseudomonadota bacterium]
MKIGLIGTGAIGHYVQAALLDSGLPVSLCLVRPARLAEDAVDGMQRVADVRDLPDDMDLMIDCAGHGALTEHGAAILARGVDLITLSLGALADAELHAALARAASDSGAQLHLASGAIGALDCLAAAQVGGLTSVTYTGRKPPLGWAGSPAEAQFDLQNLTEAQVHFEGSARQAATRYPKNANVAAAVALAGIGFDDTKARLIADPAAQANIHEVTASGAFGQFTFRIEGRALPDNPRSSALAAMSAVAAVQRRCAAITI